MTRPATDQVWQWLAEVPDPEIPAISLVDLGIIRDVAWQGDTLTVTITPTYSGCPATSVIAMDVEAALRAHGIEKLDAQAPDLAGLDNRLADRGRPRQAGSLWHRAAAAGRGAKPLPAVPKPQPGADQPVRLHPVQGDVALPRLP